MSRQEGQIIAVAIWALVLGLAAGMPRAAEEHEPSFRYNPKGHRDPFMPLVRNGQLVGTGGKTPQTFSQPVLYGVLWDPKGHSIAIINDTEVRVGETVDGYQVKQIREDAVVLSNGGEPLVLQISFEASRPSSPDTTNGGEDQ